MKIRIPFLVGVLFLSLFRASPATAEDPSSLPPAAFRFVPEKSEAPRLGFDNGTPFSGGLFLNALKAIRLTDQGLYDELQANCPHYIEYIAERSYSAGLDAFGEDMLESLKIIAMTTVGAVAYGIAMDCVTANICIEYFSTDFHYANLAQMAPGLNDFLFEAQSPYLYALTWGSIASWWVGLPLGIPLSLSARSKLGSLKDDWRASLPKLGIALGATFALSMFSGLNFYLGNPHLEDPQRRFRTDAAIHEAAYLWGTVFGLGTSLWTYLERRLEANKIDEERARFLESVLAARIQSVSETRARSEAALITSILY